MRPNPLILVSCVSRIKHEWAWQIVLILGLKRPSLSEIATPCFPQ
jgi:hypothetical protein